jgi:glycosyltransferase involved in cell wall biosynthesis
MRKNNSLPTLAVVIPNRNDSVYLEKCLNSVLNQSIIPDQIVFVDDQSSDHSVDIAQRILSSYKNSQIVSNPVCLGTMGTLNEGFKRTTCDYVLFLASNDYILKNLFERAKLSICETGLPGVWSAMAWAADKDGCPMYVYPSPVVELDGHYLMPEDCIKLAMKTASWFMGCTLFFRRAELSEIGGFDTEYQGLADLMAALTISSRSGATFFAEPLGVMRMHGGGYLSNTMSDLENIERIIRIILQKGPLLSPHLYSPVFCRRMKDRLRFTAVRSIEDIGKIDWPEDWNGDRYAIFKKLVPIMKSSVKIRTVIALLLLRPFDILPMFLYRFWGALLMNRTRYRKKLQKQLALDPMEGNQGRIW